MNPTYLIFKEPAKVRQLPMPVPALAAPPTAARSRTKWNKVLSLTELYDALKPLTTRHVSVRYLRDEVGTPLVVQVSRFFITPEDAAAIGQRCDDILQRAYMMKDIKKTAEYQQVRPAPVKLRVSAKQLNTTVYPTTAMPDFERKPYVITVDGAYRLYNGKYTDDKADKQIKIYTGDPDNMKAKLMKTEGIAEESFQVVYV